MVYILHNWFMHMGLGDHTCSGKGAGLGSSQQRSWTLGLGPQYQQPWAQQSCRQLVLGCGWHRSRGQCGERHKSGGFRCRHLCSSMGEDWQLGQLGQQLLQLVSQQQLPLVGTFYVWRIQQLLPSHSCIQSQLGQLLRYGQQLLQQGQLPQQGQLL